MTEVAEFHTQLFGSLGSPTFRSRRDVLYEAFEAKNCLGYNSSALESAEFTAIIVLALYLAKSNFKGGVLANTEPVILVVPSSATAWALEKLKLLATVLIRLRKGDAVAIRIIRDAFSLLQMTSDPKVVPPNSKRWVAFGFTKPQVPAWMRKHLV